MKTSGKVVFFAIVALIFLVMLTGCGAGTEGVDEGVMLIHVVYKEGSWSIGPEGVQVLPCSPPNLVLDETVVDSRVFIKNEAGKVVLEQNLRNPRIKMDDDIEISEGPTLLEEVETVLRLPMEQGMMVLEFFDPTESPTFDMENPAAFAFEREEEQPSLVVDLGGAMQEAAMEGFMEEPAPCMELELKPDQLQD